METLTSYLPIDKTSPHTSPALPRTSNPLIEALPSLRTMSGATRPGKKRA
jgi:hypothetical protein